MLNKYLAAAKNLLQSPGAPTSLYSDANLTLWINTARGQVAGESESIRVLGTIDTVIDQRNYAFSAIDTGVAATNGVAGTIHVRSLRYAVASGFKRINPRPWEWFELYHLNNPVPQPSFPLTWSQYAQGASGTAAGGSFYLDPPPDIVYTLTGDCVCYPIDLINDVTVEAIPYLWTDAVPYFAAYLAYLSAQTGSRQADAARMFELYTEFMQRARRFSNPSVNRYMYQQAPDIPLMGKLGLQKAQQ